MTTMVWTYLCYLLICVAITVWVARTLRRHGAIFIMDGSNTSSKLIDSQTHLMIVGFYLIVFGVISFALKYGGTAFDAQTAIELLSTKVGGVVVVIGLMHFSMLAVFSGIRDTANRRRPKVTVAERA